MSNTKDIDHGGIILRDSNLPEHDWEEQFNSADAWGLSTNIDIFNCDPEIIRNADAIKQYVAELVELIDMKTFWDTDVVHFWECEEVAGFSMTQLIETSLISWHFANLTNASYLDVFSCKYYDPIVAADFTRKFFKWEYARILPNIRYNKKTLINQSLFFLNLEWQSRGSYIELFSCLTEDNIKYLSDLWRDLV